MPRRKFWKKALTRRAAVGSPIGKYEQNPVSEQTKCPVSEQVASPDNVQAQSPVNVQAQAKQSKQANIGQSKQANIDLKSLANDCSNIQTDFDEVFADTFPDVVANYQSRINKELSENEEIAVCAQDTTFQQHAQLHQNVFKKCQSNDLVETCLENDVCHLFVTGNLNFSTHPLSLQNYDNNVLCNQVVRSSERLWNASHIVFGSFHQNDARFSEQSRGFQCTCNALCMLSYSSCLDVEKSSILDKVLCDGDALYQNIINNLKADGKFIHRLLSLEEIPDVSEVEIGKFTLEKLPIVSGILVDTQEHGLPTLHCALQSAFLSVSSGLLTIGAICSAVFKKNGLYVFFDSHSHGENGHSSNNGVSSLITFSNLDDLVTYMYAFYDSMTEEILLLRPKKLCSRRNQSSLPEKNPVFKAKEIESKQTARKDPVFKAKEMESKQTARKDPVFKAKEIVFQKESKQSARKDPVFKAKEIESKQTARKDPVFNAKEIESKQTARKDPVFKAKEIESTQTARKDPVFKAKEIESTQTARKDPVFKAKEIESTQTARKDPVFKAKEIESTQTARKDPVFKAKEIESTQTARKDPIFKAKEIESTQTARKDPVFKAKELIYQQESNSQQEKILLL